MQKPPKKLWRREMAWAVYNPEGRIVMCSIRERRESAISSAGILLNMWDELESQGWHCQQVSVYPYKSWRQNA